MICGEIFQFHIYLSPYHTHCHKCRQFLFPLVDPWSTPLEFSGMKWHGRPPIHEPLISGLGRRSNYCKIMCPIRRLLHQWRSRLRDGTPVHMLKFRKAVRLDFNGIRVNWEVFKPLLLDDTGRCHSMQGGFRDTPSCAIWYPDVCFWYQHIAWWQANFEEPGAADTEGTGLLQEATLAVWLIGCHDFFEYSRWLWLILLRSFSIFCMMLSKEIYAWVPLSAQTPF